MTVEFVRQGPVLWARIDRPDRLNAINFDVMSSLEEALYELQTRRDLSVFVLTGAGNRAFASGGDLREFADITTPAETERMSGRMATILREFEELDCWTIACANGDAYGGGCETMLAFDFRIGASTARFGFTQTRFCLPPGWGGLTRLVECVGRHRALRWLAEAAVVDADTALGAGFLDRVAAPGKLGDVTQAWAEQLAGHDRHLIGALKRGALQAAELPRSESLARELPVFCEFWTGDEHQNCVREFLESPVATGEVRDRPKIKRESDDEGSS